MLSRTYTLKYSPTNLSALQISKRFAGGGGRPGGKPTLNWKERKSLGLPKPVAKNLPKRVIPEILPVDVTTTYFDSNRGDLVITLKGEKGESANVEVLPSLFKPPISNFKKQIDINNLFGSKKVSGFLSPTKVSRKIRETLGK